LAAGPAEVAEAAVDQEVPADLAALVLVASIAAKLGGSLRVAANLIIFSACLPTKECRMAALPLVQPRPTVISRTIPALKGLPQALLRRIATSPITQVLKAPPLEPLPLIAISRTIPALKGLPRGQPSRIETNPIIPVPLVQRPDMRRDRTISVLALDR